MTIIRAGRAIESGTLADLRHLTRTSITAHLTAQPDGLAEVPGVHDLVVDDRVARFQVDTDQIEGVLRQLVSIGVHDLESRPPTLEELFLRHYRDDPAEMVP